MIDFQIAAPLIDITTPLKKIELFGLYFCPYRLFPLKDAEAYSFIYQIVIFFLTDNPFPPQFGQSHLNSDA